MLWRVLLGSLGLEARFLNTLLDLGFRHLDVLVDDHNGPPFNVDVHCLNASRLRQRLLS